MRPSSNLKIGLILFIRFIYLLDIQPLGCEHSVICPENVSCSKFTVPKIEVYILRSTDIG